MELPEGTEQELSCYAAIKDSLSKFPIRVEFLPSFMNPSDELVYLDQSSTLTIPKSTLIPAYKVARRLFLARAPLDESSDAAISELLVATVILVLVISEHSTALNFRKRVMMMMMMSRGGCTFLAAKEELAFTSLILGSPLYKHAKSPAIWGHRKWVIQRRLSLSSPAEDLRFEDELKLIMAAGETHAKNYYAWSYARWVFDRFGEHWPVSEIKSRLMRWCIRHPSDVSGWSFLLHLMRQEPAVATTVTPSSENENEAIVGEVVRFCLDIAPEREAIWLFILGVIQTLPLSSQDEQERIIQLIKSSPFQEIHGNQRYLANLSRPPVSDLHPLSSK